MYNICMSITQNETEAKVRVTTYIDADVYKELKKKAPKGYQTLLNELLRKSLFKEEDEIEQIKKRLEQLEKKIS